MALIGFLRRKLLRACIESDPRRLPQDEASALQIITADRRFTPQGSVAIVDLIPSGRDADVIITRIGDTCLALDTAGRTPEVMEGNLQQRPYNGEMIFAHEEGQHSLDAVGDAPMRAVSTIRLQLQNVTQPPHPRIILWTGTSAPDVSEEISLEHLQSADGRCDRTELEITIDNKLSSRKTEKALVTGYGVDIRSVTK